MKKIFYCLLCCFLCAMFYVKVKTSLTQDLYQETVFKNSMLVYIENELELAQYIQSHIEKRQLRIYYQSNENIDLDQSIEYLAMLNPFDLSMQQKQLISDKMETMNAYEIEIKILDSRLEHSIEFAQEVLSQIITTNMSQKEKILAIHDFIIQNCAYEIHPSSNNPSIFQAAGALLDQKAVCTGYSRGFMLMCQLLKIPVVYVASESMNHGWNYVYDGENWKFIDTTWDDPIPDQKEIVSRQYALLSPKQLFQEKQYQLSEKEYQQLQMIIHNFF